MTLVTGGIIIVLIVALFAALVNPVEFQVEVNNCAVAPRFAFAAIDHDTFALLGA